MIRKFKLNQEVEFFAGNKRWIPAKITQFGIDLDRYCILLNEKWNGDYEWWVSDIDLRC